MSDAPPADWERRIERQRAAKEEYFRENPHSPVPEAFAGLAYFPPDPDYRFVLELHEHAEKERITVDTTTGGEQAYVRYGEFRFEVDGEPVALQAYRPVDDDERFWVPFRDATSGEETYGAGRYLDLDPDEHRTDDGRWVLDFNEAYNPTCAYNEAYACPLTPSANWLDVRIEAGEKDYPGEPVEAGHHGHH